MPEIIFLCHRYLQFNRIFGGVRLSQERAGVEKCKGIEGANWLGEKPCFREQSRAEQQQRNAKVEATTAPYRLFLHSPPSVPPTVLEHPCALLENSCSLCELADDPVRNLSSVCVFCVDSVPRRSMAVRSSGIKRSRNQNVGKHLSHPPPTCGPGLVNTSFGPWNLLKLKDLN